MEPFGYMWCIDLGLCVKLSNSQSTHVGIISAYILWNCCTLPILTESHEKSALKEKNTKQKIIQKLSPKAPLEAQVGEHEHTTKQFVAKPLVVAESLALNADSHIEVTLQIHKRSHQAYFT